MNIDLVTAAKFLNHLAPDGGGWTFQTFDDSPQKRGGFARVFNVAKGQKISHELKKLNDAGAGIFVTVNKTDLKGRTAENVTAIRAVFVDGDGIPMPPRWHQSPDMIVARSVDRWHAYWRVTQDTPLERFAEAQKRLCAFYKSDPKVHDLPRVMRVPGFIHRKAEPCELSLEISEIKLRPLWQVLTGLPKLQKQDAPRSNVVTLSDIQQRARKYLLKVPGAVEGCGGDSHTFHVACVLVNDFNLGIDGARPLLIEWNRSCQPPWTAKDLEHKLACAAKQMKERGRLLVARKA